MTEEGGDDDADDYTDEEWAAFWRSMDQYQTPSALRREVFNQADELWEKTSPSLMTGEAAYVVVQDGKFRANMAGHVFVTAMANAVFRSTLNTMFKEDILDTLGERLIEIYEDAEPAESTELRPENTCPNCDEVFDPGMTTCPNCGEEL